jgi:YHS domain-containing protein
MERQAFLARRRSEIQIPNQPTDVQPVRVMNKSFFATQKNFGVGSLRASKNIPGVEISEMVDARTGKSIARIKSENSQPQPFNKARIVPRRENRIAGHAASDSFASQATHKRETSQATTKLILDDVDNAQPKLAEGSMTTVKPETNESQATAGPSEFCLQGKCPVTLSLQGKWVDGDSRWGIVHRDRTYLFSSEDNYRRFKKEPDLYSPVLAAYDPVTLHDSGTFVDGLEVNGVFMEKDGHQQIVLFSSAANREKFQAHPQRYMKSVRAAIEVASQTNGLSEDADTKVR